MELCWFMNETESSVRKVKIFKKKNEESRNRKNVLFLCENEWEMDELIEMRWLSGEKVSDDAN